MQKIITAGKNMGWIIFVPNAGGWEAFADVEGEDFLGFGETRTDAIALIEAYGLPAELWEVV